MGPAVGPSCMLGARAICAGTARRARRATHRRNGAAVSYRAATVTTRPAGWRMELNGTRGRQGGTTWSRSGPRGSDERADPGELERLGSPVTSLAALRVLLPPPLSPIVLRGTPVARAARIAAGLDAALVDELEGFEPSAAET